MKKLAKSKLSNYISETSIPGLLIIERPTFKDERGFFHEIFRLSELKSLGINFHPVQISHSFSKPRVVRAIHTETWQKLVYPVTGKMFAAFVDARTDSPDFGQVYTIGFDNSKTDSPHTAVFIPSGVGNSICVIGNEPVHYVYAVDEYWDNSKAKGIAWDDPDLNITWPVKNPIISERDRNNSRLCDLYPEKFK
jgi:dTDP-4-dehydrorhamnose 3,5-epimerase